MRLAFTLGFLKLSGRNLLHNALVAGEALSAKDRKPLFSGIVDTGMVE
jgi:hypothetical protein